jgi:hypothetical protein
VTDVKDGISGYLPGAERRPHRDLGRPRHALPRPCCEGVPPAPEGQGSARVYAD